MNRPTRKSLASFIAFTMAAAFHLPATIADGPSSIPSVPSPKVPPDLAKRVQATTDVVLEHHIAPPARQQMVLSGIRAMYQVAGVPVPSGLGRRASAVATPEQLAAFLAETWPKSVAKPIATGELEEALLRGLCESVPAGAFLSTEKESKVAEQFAGNRYVGIHIALGMDDQEKRPKIFDVFEGGPADRAGVKKDDLLEQIDGVDTKGMDVRQAVDRLRGAEGTDVTIKVRQPKESKSRTMTITRGRHVHATITGIRKRSPGGWDVRLNDADPIGYLRISEISVSTPHELLKLARQLESEGVRALVLDLRGLRGDSLHPAVLLADRLLDRGPIGRVRTARGETTYQADPDALFRGWPMAVLIDLATSGTAEWLAATLQDNHRAILIGEPTRSAIAPSSGALVRSTIPVGDGAWSITLATGQLERGDGRPLGGEVEAARDGQRRLVVAPANLDELERFQKAYRDLIAQTTQNQPIKRTDAHAKPSALGEHSRTGVTPDYLIGEKGPGSARPVQPASPGPSREPTAPADEPLGKAVELLRQSLHKSVSLGSE